MRVYDKGVMVPMEEVTWELLCKLSTYADHAKDIDVVWPDEIDTARLKAVDRVFNVLKFGG